MNLISRFISRKFQLPPAETYAVTHQRDIPIPMPDGTVLLADRYYPTQGGKLFGGTLPGGTLPGSTLPTLLVRSPYGRAGFILEMFFHPFAERGFQVLVQSCRGTFGSGGDFYPFTADRSDGLATIAWLRQQPWYSGSFAIFGPSYLSYVQWAVGDECGSELKALVPIVTTAEFRSVTFPGESFALDTILSWSQAMAIQETPPLRLFFSRLHFANKLRKAYRHLPLSQADQVASGQTVDFFQDWLAHNAPGDPYWDQSDHTARVPKVTAPVHLIGGWYDVLFPHTLACYQSLRQAGHHPYLTLGPWTHGAPGMQPVMMNETLKWMRAHLLDDPSALRKAPVRLCVMGTDQWKEFDQFPPPGYSPQRWHLQAAKGLSVSLPVESAPDRYRYNPADPTPSVGGTSLTPNAGPRDNRKLEARPDVLVYTSPILDHDLEVIGPLRAELYIKSSLQHTDFFVRLCDVFPSGKSINLSDGIVRLVPGRFTPAGDGVSKVEVELWPTANCFQAGHRIRLQVSSGAHPRFARNPGSGEPLATATRLVPADQQVLHDPAHPSAIILPVKER